MAAIKAAGYTRVICNRPDGENPPGLQAADIGKAVTPDLGMGNQHGR